MTQKRTPTPARQELREYVQYLVQGRRTNTQGEADHICDLADRAVVEAMPALPGQEYACRCEVRLHCPRHGEAIISTARNDLIATLRAHWLTGIVCDHEVKTDRATCWCATWQCPPQPNVGEAVQRWIEHVIEHATARAALAKASANQSTEDRG